MRIIGFGGSDYTITSVLCQTARLAEQNDRLHNRIAINRLCRAMYRKGRSKQNVRFMSKREFHQALRKRLRLVKG